MKLLIFFGDTVDSLRSVVGAKIKVLRKMADLSQAELAALIGCDAPIIGRYERGIHMPSIEQLIKLSTALKVSPAELLPNQDDEIRQQLISLRSQLSLIGMKIDSPVILEKIIDHAKSLDPDLD
ncbi:MULTISPECIES: helix-turn-helix domain-containing protein [Pseudomonas syringae group]|uniref:PbsX family transcriptional regulator n=2 Tax=Pseudomonas syringae group TaxID=136849 RepID=E7PUA5_PSESG|nr:MULTISPECIES: helix-turn-helix transcriptional regulator [Pseudomonas syringae group]EFW82846.1 PbsX family transcriptional regulator [Pseudomonas savastanoi pv. glycinea str. race 4]EGH16758.1 PbsX family transcriptional regulator [Pseudomonas savastanoi pv. glycinea str. race 4]KAA8703917.1 helix-turn-helix transcriptional regulator [Pseudomonas cannabina]KOP60810.1 XRE family transcriptional regulator [Pseudomonas coronafaciens pv. porri]MCQ3007822.1 helix-turn-helix domain-containing pr